MSLLVMSYYYLNVTLNLNINSNNCAKTIYMINVLCLVIACYILAQYLDGMDKCARKKRKR